MSDVNKINSGNRVRNYSSTTFNGGRQFQNVNNEKLKDPAALANTTNLLRQAPLSFIQVAVVPAQDDVVAGQIELFLVPPKLHGARIDSAKAVHLEAGSVSTDTTVIINKNGSPFCYVAIGGGDTISTVEMTLEDPDILPVLDSDDILTFEVADAPAGPAPKGLNVLLNLY